jgi:hypothetical protein
MRRLLGILRGDEHETHLAPSRGSLTSMASSSRSERQASRSTSPSRVRRSPSRRVPRRTGGADERAEARWRRPRPGLHPLRRERPRARRDEQRPRARKRPRRARPRRHARARRALGRRLRGGAATGRRVRRPCVAPHGRARAVIRVVIADDLALVRGGFRISRRAEGHRGRGRGRKRVGGDRERARTSSRWPLFRSGPDGQRLPRDSGHDQRRAPLRR